MDIKNIDNVNGEIVLYQPEENVRIEVRLDSDMETVWLTQAQMAELFQKDQSNIARHIRNVFDEGELVEDSNMQILHNTLSKYKPTKIYSLDVIISVGYRVKSQRGTMFRIWATKVLREHLLRGYSINRQLIALQERTDERFMDIQHQLSEQKQVVEFLVDMHRQPEERIFSTGCVFDAWEYVASLVKEAKDRIILIDNYCDERTLKLLAKRQAGVECTIHTRFNETFDADLEKYNRQYPAIRKVQLSQKEHDRFLMIDDTVYILGDSLKDLGHSMTTVLKTSFTVEEIIEKLIGTRELL